MNSLGNNRIKYKVVTTQDNTNNADIKLVDANMKPFISTYELIDVFAYSTGIKALPPTEIADDFHINETIICDNGTISSIIETILKTSE